MFCIYNKKINLLFNSLFKYILLIIYNAIKLFVDQNEKVEIYKA